MDWCIAFLVSGLLPLERGAHYFWLFVLWSNDLQATSGKPATKVNSILCAECEGEGE